MRPQHDDKFIALMLGYRTIPAILFWPSRWP